MIFVGVSMVCVHDLHDIYAYAHQWFVCVYVGHARQSSGARLWFACVDDNHFALPSIWYASVVCTYNMGGHGCERESEHLFVF